MVAALVVYIWGLELSGDFLEVSMTSRSFRGALSGETVSDKLMSFSGQLNFKLSLFLYPSIFGELTRKFVRYLEPSALASIKLC